MFVEYLGEKIARLAKHEEKHGQWRKVYFSVIPSRPLTQMEEVEFVFGEIGDYLRKDALSILQSKVYGVCSHQDAILAAYARAINSLSDTAKAGASPTFIEGLPGMGGSWGGIQIIGASCSAPARIVPLQYHQRTVGVCLEHNDGRELFLSGISGLGMEMPGGNDDKAPLATGAASHTPAEDRQQGNEAPCHAEQAQNMFYNAEAILQGCGASFRDVLRTWIYFPHILEWYGLFNRKRNEFFQDIGLFEGQIAQVPASTGIQGKRLDGEECFMDVLAFVGMPDKKAPWVRLTSLCQNEAYQYKSAFARAVSVTYEDIELIYLSGTASLDREGKTCYYNDEQGQILHTLTCIAGLLEQKKMSLNDLCLATVYCKNKAVYDKFVMLARHFRMGDIPFLPIYADICRGELLFEIDGIALKTRTGRA